MSARLDLDFMYVDHTKRKLSLHNTKYCLVSPHCPKSQQVLRSSWFSSSATSFLKVKKKNGLRHVKSVWYRFLQFLFSFNTKKCEWRLVLLLLTVVMLNDRLLCWPRGCLKKVELQQPVLQTQKNNLKSIHGAIINFLWHRWRKTKDFFVLCSGNYLLGIVSCFCFSFALRHLCPGHEVNARVNTRIASCKPNLHRHCGLQPH